jgi:hypothetical protein
VGSGWLVPGSINRDVSVIPSHDSLFADGNNRILTAGSYRIRIHRTSKLTAELFAEDGKRSVRRKNESGIFRVADSVEGVESEPFLLLTNKDRLPSFVGGVVHFANSGTAIWVFWEDDYNCSNTRAVIFRPSSIEWVEDRGFHGDCQR